MNVTVKIARLDALIKAFETAPERIKTNLRLALRVSLDRIVTDAQKGHKFISRSHHLENNITSNIVSKWPPVGRVFVNPAVKYAGYVHEGTGLYGWNHRRIRGITPKNAKALRWANPRGGYIFAKSTRGSDGYKGDAFLYDAARRQRDEINQIFGRYVDRALKGG